MKSFRHYSYALAIAATATFDLLAGPLGGVNGAGYGKAGVFVTPYTTKVSSNLVTVSKNFPVALQQFGVAPSTSNGDLSSGIPSAATSTTYGRAAAENIGFYVLKLRSLAANGDGTDSPAIAERYNTVPADCAELDIQTEGSFTDVDQKTGYLKLTGFATAGTAVLLQGYELLDGTGEAEQEFDLNKLKTEGVLRFDVLVVGPFDFSAEGCGMLVPFTIKTKKENFWVVANGEAKSNPFKFVNCPIGPISFGCDPVSFPSLQYQGGCEPVNVTYDKNPGDLGPGSTEVTATATDAKGTTATCKFTIQRGDSSFAIQCQDVDFACQTTGLQYPSPTITGGCPTVNYWYSIAEADLPVGSTQVTLTATDALGVTKSCTFTATRRAPSSFEGFLFEPPIKAYGGSCSDPKYTTKAGNTIPVKFTATFCQLLPGKTIPELQVFDCSNNLVFGGKFTPVGNEWHFNWATPRNIVKGNYKLNVKMPDGSSDKFVFVKIR